MVINLIMVTSCFDAVITFAEQRGMERGRGCGRVKRKRIVESLMVKVALTNMGGSESWEMFKLPHENLAISKISCFHIPLKKGGRGGGQK